MVMFVSMICSVFYLCIVVSFIKADDLLVKDAFKFSVKTFVNNETRTENICESCNFMSRYGTLCHCKTFDCFENQMMCKKQCGVCLPDIWKSARTWPKCYDHTESCKRYKLYGYCQVYYKWMKFLCKYSCGYCEKCFDENSECERWKTEGLCRTMPVYMLAHCRKACGVCDCHDHSLYCRTWAENHQCERNPAAMKRKCPLSCGICAPKQYEKPIILINNRKNDTEDFETLTKTPTTKTVTNSSQATTTTRPVITTREKTSISPTTKRKATTIPFTETGTSTLARTTTSTTTRTTPLATTSSTTAKTTPETTTSITKTSSTVELLTTKQLTTQYVTTEFTFPPFFTTEEPTTPLHEHGTQVNEEHCGVPEQVGGRYRRIVGGGELKPPNSWPWIVAITTNTHPERVDCGGSLINNQFVMTAAHCFAAPGKMDPSKYTLRLGEHHLTSNEGFEQFVQIDQIFIHQLYDKTNYDYDIALVRLQKPIEWSPEVRPACLAPHNSHVAAGKICFVAGWGNVKEGIPGPSELKVTKVPIANLNDCILDYGLILETVTERMLCASGDGKGDSCEGDSGGPLVCRRSDGNFEQIGIVSWGVGCNRKNMYGVYTDVSKQRKWIDSVVERFTRS